MPPPPPPPPGYGAYPPPPGTYPAPPYGGGGGAGPVPYGLASFGQRVGGYLIDAIVISAIVFFGFLVLGLTIPSETFDNPDPDPSGLGILVMFLSWGAAMAYPVYFEGGREGATFGKKAVGIRVVRKSNGGPLGYPLALGRTLSRFVEGFAFGLGLLWAAWDPQHQTWHDKIVGTLVVRSSVYPPPAAGPPGGPPPGYQQPAPPPY
jgi:uncharacterized RDD family membrane protein YckC